MPVGGEVIEGGLDVNGLPEHDYVDHETEGAQAYRRPSINHERRFLGFCDRSRRLTAMNIYHGRLLSDSVVPLSFRRRLLRPDPAAQLTDGGKVVASERQLSVVLSEFALTMVSDFPIQGILDRLVGRIVEMLPITGAGVTLISPVTQPQYVAASDDAALQFEQLQTELGEGPCLAAYRSGEAVSVPDLRTW